MSRVCEEFHCLPSQAVHELENDPERLALKILPLRAYAKAKEIYDRARNKMDLPESPLIAKSPSTILRCIEVESIDRSRQMSDPAKVGHITTRKMQMVPGSAKETIERQLKEVADSIARYEAILKSTDDDLLRSGAYDEAGKRLDAMTTPFLKKDQRGFFGSITGAAASAMAVINDYKHMWYDAPLQQERAKQKALWRQWATLNQTNSPAPMMPVAPMAAKKLAMSPLASGVSAVPSVPKSASASGASAPGIFFPMELPFPGVSGVETFASSLHQAPSIATTAAASVPPTPLEARPIAGIQYLTLGPAKQEPRTHVMSGMKDVVATQMGPAILNAVTSGGNVGNAIGGVVGNQIGQNVGKMVSNFAKPLTEKLGSVVGGAIGSVIPGLGNIVGSLAGSFIGKGIGAIGKLFGFGGPSKKEKEGREAYGNFGMSLVQGMTAAQRKELQHAVEADWKGNEHGAATAIVLRDSYKATGRSDQEADADYHRLFQATKKGADAVQAVIGDINKKLQEQKDLSAFLDTTLPSALKTVASSGALVSAEFAQIVERIDATGKSSAAINEFVNSQAMRAVGGIQTFLDNTTFSTQASATAMANAVAASFEEMTRRGMSVPETLAAMQPSIAAVQEQLATTGFAGTESFAALQSMAALAADTVAGPMLRGVAGLNDTLIGLQNAGVMTQEMFAGVAGQVTASFESLIAQGFNSDQVLQLMQPTLQTVWQLMADFGYQIDDATGHLIAQAQEAGLVGDAHRNASEVATKAMQDAATAMKDVAEVLQRVFGEAGGQGEAFAGRVNTAIGSIPRNIDITVTGRYVPPNVPGSSGDSGESFHSGGIVRAHSGWIVSGGLWSDEVPAILQTGEGVLSRRGMAAFDALNQGRVPAAGGQPTNAEVVSELRDVKRLLRDQPRALKIAMQDALALSGGR